LHICARCFSSATTGRRVRVVATPLTFGDVLRAALEPIALASDDTPLVWRRLLETLRMLGGVARRHEDAVAVQEVASLVVASANRGLGNEGYRAELAHLRAAVGNEVSAVHSPEQASGREPRAAG
jgi:uncharacterized membrane protein